ncbi:hypothetical protein PSHT_12330 [Puccinia striiformis]|uniref:Uncharacterized protein n=2 Tax=Puccinia striiformis TaxID=27350 RepID=A0A2S4UX61_9BASI|nr:hypothetical protein PSHT_12330 [Puccinia striiformis]
MFDCPYIDVWMDRQAGSKPLDPPQPGPSAADELAVGQPAFVSKKRSREGSDSHNENLHVEGRQSARKQNQPVDERAEPVGMAFGLNRPRDFEIMSSNPKWDPLFTWVKRSIGETKDSSIMDDFVARIDDGQKLNKVLPYDRTRKQISSSDMSVKLLLTNENPHTRQGCLEFLIQLEDLKGQGKSRNDKLDSIKKRLLYIVEALGLFHGLAVSHGLDPQMLGSFEDLLEWFGGIIFEETEDGPPLFGSFTGTWEAAEQALKRFGSVKRVVSMVLANSRSPVYGHIDLAPLALSLLGYRYQMNELRLGQRKLSIDYAEAFWDTMEQTCQNKETALAQSDKLMTEVQKEITLLTDWTESSLHSFLKSLNGIGRTWVYCIHPTVREQIHKRVLKFISRSRFDLKHAEKVNIEGSPIYLIPVSQGQVTSTYQEAFIGILDFEKMGKLKPKKIYFLEYRITQILRSLDLLHGIASKIVGEKNMISSKNLIEWYLNVLFEESHGRLPIFGWIKMPSNPDQSLKGLFGRASIFLSKNLADPGKQTEYHTHSIAITLFGIWYEEIALEYMPIYLHKDHSWKKLLNKMASFD